MYYPWFPLVEAAVLREWRPCSHWWKQGHTPNPLRQTNLEPLIFVYPNARMLLETTAKVWLKVRISDPIQKCHWGMCGGRYENCLQFTNLSGTLQAFTEAVEHTTCSGMIKCISRISLQRLREIIKDKRRHRRHKTGWELGDKREVERSEVKAR